MKGHIICEKCIIWLTLFIKSRTTLFCISALARKWCLVLSKSSLPNIFRALKIANITGNIYWYKISRQSWTLRILKIEQRVVVRSFYLNIRPQISLFIDLLFVDLVVKILIYFNIFNSLLPHYVLVLRTFIIKIFNKSPLKNCGLNVYT